MATTVSYKGSTLTTVDNQTKVLQTAGTWMEDDLTLVDVSGGGGIDIGVQTPVANLLSMIYELNHSTAKTGTFTLAQSIPNTAEQIFDANDATVTQFAIFEEGEIILDPNSNPAQAFIVLWLNSTDVLRRLLIQDSYKNLSSGVTVSGVNPSVDISIETGANYWQYAYWTWSGGVLNVKGQYNHNATYTPFRPNKTYRWVAW